MAVTISSTTDTEADVRAAAGHTATEPDPQAVPVEETPVEDAVDATPEIELASESLSDEEDAPEPVEAVGELATEDDEVGSESQDAVSTEEEPEDVAEAAPKEAPKKKRRRRGRSYKDRASQLAREKATESARADALADELSALQSRQNVPPPPTNADPIPEPGAQDVTMRPDQSKFETYESFQEALVDWKVSQRLSAHEREQSARVEAEQKQQGRRNVVAAHTARIDAFRDENPDFDAVISKAKDLPVTPPMQDTVLHSEHGPALMYHLCQNPEECDRIAQMHPRDAIKEIGRLEAQLDVARSTTGPTPRAEPVTKAPRPIKPVGGGVTASTVPLDQMSYQDYKRARERQIAFAQGRT